VALLKDVLANVNATSGIVPYTLHNKQSARRVFVFLKQIVGAMAMAGTPQKMAPRVLESLLRRMRRERHEFQQGNTFCIR
jgi:hypothetical protein